MSGLGLQSYNEVFDRALIISIGLGLEFKDTSPALTANGNWQPNFKRFQNQLVKGNNSFGPINGRASFPPCNICGKTHFGQCMIGMPNCYHCHKPGYRAYECTQVPVNQVPLGNPQYRPAPGANNQLQPPLAKNFQAGQQP